MPESTKTTATLAGGLPDVLEVGLGNVLSLEGTLGDGDVPATLEAGVGANRVPALALGVPAPGEVTGSGWWQALVPVARVGEPHRATVTVTVKPRHGTAATTELGGLRLEPGTVPAAVRASPGAGRVAICMATHEPPAELFRSQVDSIRTQTHADWTCLISDDASSAGALAEIERVIAGDPRFELHRNDERVGFYRNFERALKLVPPEADLVALCDQDDRWHPDKLAALIAALGANDVLAHSDARVVRPDGSVVAETFWPAAVPGDRLADLIYANAVSGASALFRADALAWVLPLPGLAGRAFHDRWIALVCGALGGIARVERPLYDYVQHEAAAHGHERAVGRVRPRLLGRARRPNWRAAHDGFLARSVSEAIVLRLRLGDRLSARDRRRLRRIEALPRSAGAQARLALRWLARAPRKRPGLEGALLRGVVWQRLAPLRSARARTRTAPPAKRRPARRSRPGGRPRYGITVTRDRESAGFGDYYIAHELGEELSRLGVEVDYLELDAGGWRRKARSLDLIVSLLDRFPIDQAPPGTATVAWVRNWTDRWLAREWFGRYDLVFASSEESCRLIGDRAAATPRLLPLATDPAHFRPVEPDPALAADLTFVGNHWGVERDVQHALPRLAEAGLEVKVFGRGWEAVPGMRELSRGPVSHAELPVVYASAAVVVDDSAGHARPFGCVNSRVFDALACGAFVASNDAAGVRALFGERFPTWRDESGLRAQVELVRGDPTGARARVDPLRARVTASHTYALRAREIREAASELADAASSSARNTNRS